MYRGTPFLAAHHNITSLPRNNHLPLTLFPKKLIEPAFLPGCIYLVAGVERGF